MTLHLTTTVSNIISGAGDLDDLSHAEFRAALVANGFRWPVMGMWVTDMSGATNDQYKLTCEKTLPYRLLRRQSLADVIALRAADVAKKGAA